MRWTTVTRHLSPGPWRQVTLGGPAVRVRLMPTMQNPPDKPRLRYLDIFPVSSPEGGELIGLRDPSGVSEETLVVTHAAILVLRHMDGLNDVRDIQAHVMRATGQLIDSEHIEGMVATLDEALFLDSPRFEQARATQIAEYDALTHRPAALAGGSYPDDPDELNEFLESFWHHEGGPGGPPDASGIGSAEPAAAGLIAPHIDYHRGGPAYAHAYRALAEQAGDARLFVVFGTSHAGCDGLFGLTRKGYDTPLGPIPCDTDLLDDIVARSDGAEWFAGDHAHRQEHSIEFQVVWLRKLWSEAAAPDLRILPILCGSFDHWIEGDSPPSESPRIEAMVRAVTDALAARGEPAIIIAGADLAHIGPRFGDPAPPTPEELRQLADDDARTLQHCTTTVDADAFYRDVTANDDPRRICGLAPIYMTLRTSAATAGELLQYGQAEDPAGPSTVSFASVSLTR